MKKAIECAIEGGYNKFPGYPDFDLKDNILCSFKDSDGYPVEVKDHFLLDPEFWRCLGTRQGWEEKMVDGTNYLTYRRYWKDFIDYLSEGGKANSFFKKILK